MDGMYAGFAGAKAGHGGAALSRGLGVDGLSLASTCRGHVVAQRAVGSEHPVETGEVHPRLGYQGSEPGDEVERLEDDVGSAVPVRRFQGVSNIPLWCER